MAWKRMLAAAVAGATAVAGLLPSASQAHSGATEGPQWLDGVGLTSAGEIGRAGGLTWTYTNVDLSGFDHLWWGARDGEVKLAMDGAIDEDGETLAYSDAGSDLANGIVRFAGSAELPGLGVYPTRLTFRAFTDAALPAQTAASAGIGGDVGAVVAIPGDYSANVLFEVFSGGTWKPAADFFDAAHTDPSQADHLITSFWGAFWFVRSNVAPDASFDVSPTDAHALQEVTFTSTSNDSDGAIASTEWDLDGDGVYEAAGTQVVKTYAEGGTYTVSIRVTDDDGAISTASQDVEIAACEQGPVTQTARAAGEDIDDVAGPGPVGAEQVVHELACGPLYGTGL